MDVVVYTFVPGPCRVCSAAPKVKGNWVACSDPLCPLSHYRQTRVTWPRKRVIDWKETLLGVGALTGQGIAFLAVLTVIMALLLLLTGCDRNAEKVTAVKVATVKLPLDEYCSLERVYCLSRYSAGLYCFPPSEPAAIQACDRIAGGQ